MSSKAEVQHYFESIAATRLVWKKRNRFYHRSLENYFTWLIPVSSRVMEIGCGTGDLLAAVRPSYGLGIDFSENMIEIARSRYPELNFIQADIEESEHLVVSENETRPFDYVILSDLLHILWDVQKSLQQLKRYCGTYTRIIISNYNYMWEPLLRFGELIGLKQKSPNSNWLTPNDIRNLLEIEGFQVITNTRKILLPKYIPFMNFIFNRVLVNLPLLNYLGLVNFFVARPIQNERKDYKVSIIIPAKNEKGNIEQLMNRIPVFGLSREFVFVEGQSEDNTYEEILRVKNLYPREKITVVRQTGKGKGNAVREGFEAASGEAMVILDADLTTPPEDLMKFYSALSEGRGEFINGCRLVYPMEKQAMRFLNLMANRYFSIFFTFLLGQRLKDTLCGTKMLFKQDYEKIKANRTYFGEFDPFGDFDLLFGAAKLNLKITEVLVRYKERKYGSTQISRFRHGLLLLRMSIFAAVKLKFN
ncbi:MAG: glycosyltransferase [Bacteroidales bacterium]|nr:glycosyltransferase [Bacteroidales bacterium]